MNKIVESASVKVDGSTTKDLKTITGYEFDKAKEEKKKEERKSEEKNDQYTLISASKTPSMSKTINQKNRLSRTREKVLSQEQVLLCFLFETEPKTIE